MMNRVHLLVLCFFVSYFSLEAQDVKRFALKTGYVKLELSGSTVGTRELWWDNYGARTKELEKSTTTTKIFGMKSTEELHKLTILVKDRFWTVDYIQNTGTTGRVLAYQEGQEIMNDLSDEAQAELEDDILSAFGGQKLGTEKLGSYECDVFTLLGIKSWVYKGVILKSKGKVLGIVSDEMYSSFKPNVSLNASEFLPPKSIDFENLSQKVVDTWAETLMEEDEEDDFEEIVPLSYDYEKFKKIVNEFSHEGYQYRGCNSLDGVYACTYTKGLTNSIMIIAESASNTGDELKERFESLLINGKNGYYGQMEDEDGAVLIVDYPRYKMHVIIGGMPAFEKKELVEIAKKLNF